MDGSTVDAHFCVSYDTQFGQNIVLSLGTADAAGGERLLPLAWSPSGWRGHAKLPLASATTTLVYKYGLVSHGSSVVFEWGPRRRLVLHGASTARHVEVRDAWAAPSAEHVFHSPRIAAALFGRQVLCPPDQCFALSASRLATNSSGSRLSGSSNTGSGQQAPPLTTGVTADWERQRSQEESAATLMTVRFSVVCPRVQADQRVYVVGGCPALGSWDVSRAAPLDDDTRFPVWSGAVAVQPTDLPCEYKFVISGPNGAGVVWEDGPNRVLAAPEYVRIGSVTSPVRLVAALRQPDSGARTRHALPPALLFLATQEVMLARGLPALDPGSPLPGFASHVAGYGGSPTSSSGGGHGGGQGGQQQWVGMDVGQARAFAAEAGADPDTWVAVPSVESLQAVRDELAEVELDKRRAAAQARRAAEEEARVKREAAAAAQALAAAKAQAHADAEARRQKAAGAGAAKAGAGVAVAAGGSATAGQEVPAAAAGAVVVRPGMQLAVMEVVTTEPPAASAVVETDARAPSQASATASAGVVAAPPASSAGEETASVVQQPSVIAGAGKGTEATAVIAIGFGSGEAHADRHAARRLAPDLTVAAAVPGLGAGATVAGGSQGGSASTASSELSIETGSSRPVPPATSSTSGAAMAWGSAQEAASPRPVRQSGVAGAETGVEDGSPQQQKEEERSSSTAAVPPSSSAAAPPAPHAASAARAAPPPETVILITETRPRFTSSPWRGAGVVVPLHALRSHRDHGMGDFSDLKAFIGWAASAGLTLVQVPPVMDTHGTGAGTESSPYRPVSAFALHPGYISITDLVEEVQQGAPPRTSSHSRDGSVGAAGFPATSGSGMPAGQPSSSLGMSSPAGDAAANPARPVIPAHLLSRIASARDQLNRPHGSGEGPGQAGHGHGHGHGLSDRGGSVEDGGEGGPGSMSGRSGGGGVGGAPGRPWENLLGVRPAPSSPAHDLHAGGLHSATTTPAFRGGFDARSAALRPALDYEAAVRTKAALLRELYRAVGEWHLSSPEFASFYAANADWLQPYALYCVMRELMGSPNPQDWGSRKAVPLAVVHALTDPSALHYKAVAFVYWQQFVAHKQLSAAVARAQELGVVLQMELPVGALPASADAWSRPGIVKQDRRLGSPPDPLAREGAAWAVAPFDWATLGRERYGWWRRRLARVSQYFSGVVLTGADTYFRSYEVPSTAVTGLAGAYSPSLGLSMLELRGSGLWDARRLTQPYVREWGVRAALGQEFAALAARFFRIREGGVYEFREGVGSEAGIRAALEGTPHAHLAGPLISLLTNVCMLELPAEEDGVSAGEGSAQGNTGTSSSSSGTTSFHPRVDYPSTTSYLELEDSGQAAVGRLAQAYADRQRALWLQAGVARIAGIMGQGPGTAGSNLTLSFAANDLACSAEAADALRHMGVLGTRTHKLPAPGEGPGSGATAGLEPVASGHGRPFSDPTTYAWGSMSVSSTLDGLPLRAWWESDPALAAHFYHAVMGTAPPMPPVGGLAGGGGASGQRAGAGQATGSTDSSSGSASGSGGAGGVKGEGSLVLSRTCTPDICTSLVRLHMSSPAMWALFPLQDLLGTDPGLRHPESHAERACLRAADLRGTHVWRWRCHVAVEELQGEPGRTLTARIRGLVAATGRQLPAGKGAPGGVVVAAHTAKMQKEWALPSPVYESAAGSYEPAGAGAGAGSSSSSGRPTKIARPASRSAQEDEEGSSASGRGRGGRGGGAASSSSSAAEGAGSSARGRSRTNIPGASSAAGGSAGGGARLVPPHPIASDEPPLHLHFKEDGHLTPSSLARSRVYGGHKGGKTAAEVESRSKDGRYKGKAAGVTSRRSQPPQGQPGRLFKMSAAPGVNSYTDTSPKAGERAGKKRKA